jgi:hypothetical protein
LNRDAAAILAPAAARDAALPRHGDKLWLPAARFAGGADGRPRVLSAICLLESWNDATTHPVLSDALPPQTAFRHLMAALHGPGEIGNVRSDAFHLLSAVAAAVPVHGLRRPRDLASLDAVAACLESAFGE